jgi:RNA polymerase sigma factor (sigma-70 family)
MLKELNQIQIGDYIVHIDHGIGKFGGLQKLDVNGKEQEVIKLIYKNDDVIFVSIHGLHRISKYKGKDGEAPTINKLGTGAWDRMKERTKKKIKDIARDLIKLYAQRLKEKGFAFSTYAVPVIMGEVRRLFRDGGAVKVSRSIKELYLKITKEKEVLEQKLNREATVNELATALGVSAEEVTEALCASQTPVSLTVENDDGISETDLPTHSPEEEICNKVLLDTAFKYLEEDEIKILKYRFYNSFTQSKTAKLLNMSQVQISRAEKKILLNLRYYLT